jgi:putative membrane protein
MKRRNISAAAPLVALLFAAACSRPGLAPPPGASSSTSANATAISNPTVGDQAFLTQAAYGGLAEVTLGQLATKKGGSESIREFGSHMVNDHSSANQELVALAKSKGMTPPTAPDPGRQATATALGTLEGTNFDYQYVQQQLMEHQVALALYRAEAQSGTDPAIRQFAAKWAPALEAHAASLRPLAGNVAAR